MNLTVPKSISKAAQSRKFLYTVLGSAALVAGSRNWIDMATAKYIAGLFGVLTAGQAVADHGAGGSESAAKS